MLLGKRVANTHFSRLENTLQTDADQTVHVKTDANITIGQPQLIVVIPHHHGSSDIPVALFQLTLGCQKTLLNLQIDLEQTQITRTDCS